MIIRYIGLTKYNDIKKYININLGGNFCFSLQEGNKIGACLVDNYIDGDYMYKSGVKEISAIVGKNGTGKTTVLRMISKVIGNKGNGYVLIEEDIRKSIYYIYTDLDVNYSEAEKLLCEQKCTIEKVGPISNKYQNTTQIFFSNIFDKTCPLDNSDNLIDISTNKELRKYLGEDSEDKFVKDSKPLKDKTIADFRRSEIDKKIELAIYLKDIDLAEQRKLIFSFPEYINIFFSEDWEHRDLLFNESSKNLSLQEKNELENITTILKERIDNKNDALKEFCAYAIQEVILKRLCEDKNSFGFIKKTLKQMEEKIPILSGVINYKEEFDEKRSNVSTENTKKQNTYRAQNTLEITLNSIDKLIETLENLNYTDEEYNIEDIEENLNHINSYLGEIGDNKSIYALEAMRDNITDLKENYNEYEIEEIDDMIEKLLYALETLRYEIYEEQDEHNGDLEVVTNDIKMLYNMDEVAIAVDAEELLDKSKESLTRELNNVIMLMNLLQRILYKANTRISKDGENKEDRSIRVELRDENVLNFYKMFHENEYQTFDLIVDHDDLSSGQNAYLDMCARLYSCTKNVELMEKESLLLLLDEAELFLHPQAQVKYIDNLLWLIPQIFKKKGIQIILTTNSPFLVSDIQQSNVLTLNSLTKQHGLDTHNELGKTFGTNINTLLLNKFFMDEGIIGVHAKNTINDLITRINDLKDNVYDEFAILSMKKVINNIGDSLIRKKLNQLLDENINSDVSIEQQIVYHKRMLFELEKKKNKLAEKEQ